MGSSLPSLRQMIRQAGCAWRNRRCLPRLLTIYTHDDLEKHSLGILRRVVSRGHALSAKLHRPVDVLGAPLPWYTYPFVDYLADLDTSSWNVLEFGSGQSTLYWARRAQRVVTFENKRSWFDEFRRQSPSNVDVRLFSDLGCLDTLPELMARPDLIVVDGWEREACTRRCVDFFGLEPLYVLDNSDWHRQIGALLRSKGCQEIRFKGFGPINSYAWSTSLFFTAQNAEKLRKLSDLHNVPGGSPPGFVPQPPGVKEDV